MLKKHDIRYIEENTITKHIGNRYYFDIFIAIGQLFVDFTGKGDPNFLVSPSESEEGRTFWTFSIDSIDISVKDTFS